MVGDCCAVFAGDGACVKLAAPAMQVLQSSFFVKRSAASLHFALLCSLSLLGMVQEPPLPRRASQSQELSAFSGTADATVQQRLMQLLHAICCAAILAAIEAASASCVTILPCCIWASWVVVSPNGAAASWPGAGAMGGVSACTALPGMFCKAVPVAALLGMAI